MNKTEAMNDFLSNTLQVFVSSWGFQKQDEETDKGSRVIVKSKAAAELAVSIAQTPALVMEWRRSNEEESVLDARLYVVQDIDHIEYELERLINNAIAHGRELGKVEALQAIARASDAAN